MPILSAAAWKLNMFYLSITRKSMDVCYLWFCWVWKVIMLSLLLFDHSIWSLIFLYQNNFASESNSYKFENSFKNQSPPSLNSRHFFLSIYTLYIINILSFLLVLLVLIIMMFFSFLNLILWTYLYHKHLPLFFPQGEFFTFAVKKTKVVNNNNIPD